MTNTDPALGQLAQLARWRPSGEPTVEVPGGGNDQGTVTSVRIITDDCPYLVESVLAGATRVDARVRRVTHPRVLVHRTPRGELVEAWADQPRGKAEPGGKKHHTEMWMVLELEPFPADEAEELAGELRAVLGELRAVVEDHDRLLAVAQATADQLAERRVPGSGAATAEDAELLDWLVEGHFTFLGYRRYQLVGDHGEPRFASVAGSGLGVLRGEDFSARAPLEPSAEELAPTRLALTRADRPGRVIRTGSCYELTVSDADDEGGGRGERRFLGMFTAVAGAVNILDIPVVGTRVRAAILRTGVPLESYDGQRMLEIIAHTPREELFWVGELDLSDLAAGVLSLNEPRRLRLFVRREPLRRFFSCLVYLPKDRYSTRVRLALQRVLLAELTGWRIEHSVRIGESDLALVHFVVHTDTDVAAPHRLRLQAQLAASILTWDEWVLDVAGQGDHAIAEYLPALPEGYKDAVDPVQAVADLRQIHVMDAGAEPALTLEPGARPHELRMRLFLYGPGITLSAIMPVLQSLGVDVLDEQPYEIVRPDGGQCWIYQFGLRFDAPTAESTQRDSEGGAWRRTQQAFREAFLAIWRGDAEVDGFNALVLRVGLDWRHAALMRAYAAYIRQLGGHFEARYVAEVLIAHPRATRALVALFLARFDPTPDIEPKYAAAARTATILVDEALALDADRILRAYLTAILATLRTNYFRARPYLSLKIDPRAIPEAPAPRPNCEILVYSPRLEGVHLRFGPIARGGLRWSDRQADYRTEILGLVKAQAVKNAVIVPVGAKGGFVVKTANPSPEQVADCYRTFISGLLDLTDNLIDGATIAPPDTVRHDGDDSYLVVAADKGTAKFSDLANQVADDYGFWLGDAFASGGSVGYDHKAMGITARGAWESVKRHFRELGVDTQSESFTVVGIGDMSGDVFGNGMLLSQHIRLIAAFNHNHVFLDPGPDPVVSFHERCRLAALPGSSWEDYDRGLLSPGGGVWARTVKSIPIAAPARIALGLPEGIDSLAPPELVRAILCAPADLLWNGGIGTYVKSHDETHGDVRDKANDAVRVDGAQLRVKVVGEGGNLGLTQRGRIEFALAGGKLNTDAVDNSAGVDCSDHEVNIKILLEQLVERAAITRDRRNGLLREMSDDVADLVLANNRAQNFVLGLDRTRAADSREVHARLIDDLALRGLDRALELLPDAEGFAELRRTGRGLSSPELATLLAHVKLDLTARILATDLPELAEFGSVLRRYFPAALGQGFPDSLAAHPLGREIITTVLVNDMVDHAGLSFAFRLGEELSATPSEAVCAYQMAATVFDLRSLWAALNVLPPTVSCQVVDQIALAARDVLDAAARWLLSHRPRPLRVSEETTTHAGLVARLRARLPQLLRGTTAEALARRASALLEHGVPAPLATASAGLDHSLGLLDIVELAEGRRSQLSVEDLAELYFILLNRQNPE